MMRDDELLEYARTGLKTEIAVTMAKLEVLTAKLKALGTPTKRGGRKQAASSSMETALQSSAMPAEPKRQRRKRTAAERKAVSLRMKKYWAERRKAKGEK
jgi:hypothetical protein